MNSTQLLITESMNSSWKKNQNYELCLSYKFSPPFLPTWLCDLGKSAKPHLNVNSLIRHQLHGAVVEIKGAMYINNVLAQGLTQHVKTTKGSCYASTVLVVAASWHDPLTGSMHFQMPWTRPILPPSSAVLQIGSGLCSVALGKLLLSSSPLFSLLQGSGWAAFHTPYAMILWSTLSLPEA